MERMTGGKEIYPFQTETCPVPVRLGTLNALKQQCAQCMAGDLGPSVAILAQGISALAGHRLAAMRC